MTKINNNKLHIATKKFLFFINAKDTSKETLEAALEECANQDLWYEFGDDMHIIIPELNNALDKYTDDSSIKRAV